MSEFEVGDRVVILKGNAKGSGGDITEIHSNKHLNIRLDSGYILPGVKPENVKLSRLPKTV